MTLQKMNAVIAIHLGWQNPSQGFWVDPDDKMKRHWAWSDGPTHLSWAEETKRKVWPTLSEPKREIYRHWRFIMCKSIHESLVRAIGAWEDIQPCTPH